MLNLINYFSLFIFINLLSHINFFFNLICFNNILFFIFFPVLNILINFILYKNYFNIFKIILFINTVLIILLNSINALILVITNQNSLYFNFNYINFINLTININFIFDSLSILMIFIISFISFLVHLYSIDYMKYDKNLIIFLLFLNLFTFFMIFLVIAGNLFQILIGWEGVGLTSYLLINFWYNRFEANKSSIKAITINKIGDLMLFFFIILNFYLFNTLNILQIKYIILSNNINFNIINLLSCLIFIAAIAKSAQLGLHTWLPDAMEGPTPVSALLHAATMVTAGIFLLIRFNFIIENSIFIMKLIVIIGSLTAIFGSLLSLVQFDIKKIIAYSTLSQLGYMFTVIGFYGYNIALYHLLTHAFFKALLSLCSGIIIHYFNNEQDIRKYGSIYNIIPLLYIFIIIGFLALAGFPYLSGFYSKDLIIELALCYFYTNFIYNLSSILLLFAAFLTTFYSIRTIYYIFFIKFNFIKINLKLNYNLNLIQIISLFPLIIGSIFLGFYLYNYIISINNVVFLNNSIIFFFPEYYIHLLSFELKLLPFFSFLFGLIFGLIYYFNFEFKLFNKYLIKLKYNKFYFYFFKLKNFILIILIKKFYIDFIYNRFIGINFFYFFFNFIFYKIDRGIFQNIYELFSNKLFNNLINLNIKNKYLNLFENQIKILLLIYFFFFLIIFFIINFINLL